MEYSPTDGTFGAGKPKISDLYLYIIYMRKYDPLVDVSYFFQYSYVF